MQDLENNLNADAYCTLNFGCISNLFEPK